MAANADVQKRHHDGHKKMNGHNAPVWGRRQTYRNNRAGIGLVVSNGPIRAYSCDVPCRSVKLTFGRRPGSVSIQQAIGRVDCPVDSQTGKAWARRTPSTQQPRTILEAEWKTCNTTCTRLAVQDGIRRQTWPTPCARGLGADEWQCRSKLGVRSASEHLIRY